MAQKQVRVRYKRTMGIGKDKHGPGFETLMDETQATKWAANGRIEIVATGKEKARPAAGAVDPSQAPPSGSPAGSGALSSSSLPGRPAVTSTGKNRGRPPKAKPVIDPFG